MIHIKVSMFMLLLTAVTLPSCTRETNPADADQRPSRLDRPVLRNNTIHTAWGTPIRGTSVGVFMYPHETGAFDNLPRPKDYDGILNGGVNTLQIKLETPMDGKPAGYRVQTCDRLVDEAEQRGLYFILCIGAMTGYEENYDNEISWMKDFWNFYAPRYRDRKHVIFEICNEFGHYDSYGAGFEACIEGQASLYRTIRTHAPETIVILWSFSHTLWKWDFPVWMRALEDHIPGGTKNVAVGIHSYECGQDAVVEAFFDHWGAEGLRSVVHTFIDLGYPVINTEMPYRASGAFVDVPMFRVLEEEGISWIGGHFDVLGLPSHWRGEFDAAGIAWTPDYGNWPVPDAHCPFNASSGGGISLFADIATLNRLNFGTREPRVFVADAEAEGAGRFEIRLKDGTLVGSCPISTGIDSVKVPILKPVKGIPDIVLDFRADVDGEKLRLRNWKFEVPHRDVYQYPFRTVYFADYPYRTGTIERGYNTDPASNAPLNVQKVTHGSILTFDLVQLDNKNATTLHIRARTLAGGKIRVIAGRLIDNPFEWNYNIGTVEINGARGMWTEFVIPVNIDDGLLNEFDWDLNFIFESATGGTQELFELSEFVFK